MLKNERTFTTIDTGGDPNGIAILYTDGVLEIRPDDGGSKDRLFIKGVAEAVLEENAAYLEWREAQGGTPGALPEKTEEEITEVLVEAKAVVPELLGVAQARAAGDPLIAIAALEFASNAIVDSMKHGGLEEDVPFEQFEQSVAILKERATIATSRALEGRESKLEFRPVSNERQIDLYLHCAACLAERPPNVSARDWAQTEVGWTQQGLQVWCKRHECNIMHVDFEGRQHPANTTRKSDA